jgi:hypothetical protein
MSASGSFCWMTRSGPSAATSGFELLAEVGARFSCLGIHTLTDGLLTTSRIELPVLGNGGCAAGSAQTEVWGP